MSSSLLVDAPIASQLTVSSLPNGSPGFTASATGIHAAAAAAPSPFTLEQQHNGSGSSSGSGGGGSGNYDNQRRPTTSTGSSSSSSTGGTATTGGGGGTTRPTALSFVTITGRSVSNPSAAAAATSSSNMDHGTASGRSSPSPNNSNSTTSIADRLFAPIPSTNTNVPSSSAVDHFPPLSHPVTNSIAATGVPSPSSSVTSPRHVTTDWPPPPPITSAPTTPAGQQGASLSFASGGGGSSGSGGNPNISTPSSRIPPLAPPPSSSTGGGVRINVAAAPSGHVSLPPASAGSSGHSGTADLGQVVLSLDDPRRSLASSTTPVVRHDKAHEGAALLRASPAKLGTTRSSTNDDIPLAVNGTSRTKLEIKTTNGATSSTVTGDVSSSSSSSSSSANATVNDHSWNDGAIAEAVVTVSAERSRHESVLTIAKNRENKRNVEQGIIKFNAKPKAGISWLIKNKVISETPLGVAKFLLNTDGLRKEQIGEYLGDHDKFAISVMHAYVDLIDFSGRTFDAALRLFLERFRLPGESQKIDRMMEKFAEKFCRDNPGLFTEQDAAYLLAYSLIMLNTDAHSPKVKHKMTKASFLRNCRDLLKQGLSKQYLSQCYDNIVKNEIKVSYDYLEQLYSRLLVNDVNEVELLRRAADGKPDDDVKSPLSPHSPDDTKSRAGGSSSVTGATSSDRKDDDKDGKDSKSPLADGDDDIDGGATREPIGQYGHQGYDALRADHKDANTGFNLARIAHVGRLRTGHVFIKYGRRGKPHPRKVWLSDDLRSLLYQDAMKPKSRVTSLSLEEITDVAVGHDTTEVLKKEHLPDVRDTLCFSIITPKRTLDLEGDVAKDVNLWVNFITQVVNENKRNIRAIATSDQRIIKENRVLVSIRRWKEFVLPNWSTRDRKTRAKIRAIWINGIPSSLRSIVWPLAISNALEITPELFESFIKLARLNQKSFGENKSTGFLGQEKSIAQLQHDLPITYPELKFFHTSSPNLLYSQLRDILQAYMLYRPDIGYMSGMSHLLATLLLYTDVYQAFVCFANLLHSPFFLSFCRMDKPQMRWRFNFFSELFRTQLPLLFNHFAHLELFIDEFFLDWCMALYTRVLPLDIVCRVWDQYLCDGEIVVYRIALAILKYHQKQLLRSSFDDCLYLLTNVIEINEESFWAGMEQLSLFVDQKVFDDLSKRHATKGVAGLSSRVHTNFDHLFPSPFAPHAATTSTSLTSNGGMTRAVSSISTRSALPTTQEDSPSSTTTLVIRGRDDEKKATTSPTNGASVVGWHRSKAAMTSTSLLRPDNHTASATGHQSPFGVTPLTAPTSAPLSSIGMTSLSLSQSSGSGNTGMTASSSSVGLLSGAPVPERKQLDQYSS